MVSSLVDAVLHTLDDAITPAAYWVLELLDSKDDLQQVTREIASADKIHEPHCLWAIWRVLEVRAGYEVKSLQVKSLAC